MDKQNHEMSSIFEEVYLYDYDDEKLSFYKRYHKPFNIEVIDESDKLLIRSRSKINNDNVSLIIYDLWFFIIYNFYLFLIVV